MLDNNLPPAWAETIAAASCSSGALPYGNLGEVLHLRSKFKHNTEDTEWLTPLGREGGWTVISGDAFRKKNGAERQVIRRYGISIFVLQPSWSNRRYWEKLSQFVGWWPEIVEQANKVEAAALEVPWRRTSKFKQI